LSMAYALSEQPGISKSVHRNKNQWRQLYKERDTNRCEKLKLNKEFKNKRIEKDEEKTDTNEETHKNQQMTEQNRECPEKHVH